MNRPSDAGQEQERAARRHPMHLPVRYRPLGDDLWLAGMAANVSSSGILLRCPRTLPLGSAMEIALSLPVAADLDSTVDVLYIAVVVRLLAPKGPNGLPAMAARFLKHQYRVDQSPTGQTGSQAA